MRVRSLTLVAVFAVILVQDVLAQSMNSVPLPPVADQLGAQPPALKLPPTKGLSPFDDLRQTRPEPWSRHDRNSTRGSTEALVLVQDAVRERSVGRKVIGGFVGAVGGFFAGGYTGAAIEGDSCDCDDPGLKGFLIGAPVGAILGGIAGAKWLF